MKIKDIKKKIHKKNLNKVKEEGQIKKDRDKGGIQLKKEKESEKNKEAYVKKPNMGIKLKNLLFYKVFIWFRLSKEKVNQLINKIVIHRKQNKHKTAMKFLFIARFWENDLTFVHIVHIVHIAVKAFSFTSKV